MRTVLHLAMVAVAAALAAPASAADRGPPPHRVLVCKNVRHEANKGTVVGAIAGGLLGSAVAGHGARTEGTVLGAGVGAVAGHQIAKKNAKKHRECHYVERR